MAMLHFSLRVLNNKIGSKKPIKVPDIVAWWIVKWILEHALTWSKHLEIYELRSINEI